MKKIISAITTIASIASVTSFSSVAQAVDGIVDSSGTVAATCNLTVTNGAFPAAPGIVTSLDSSASKGKISTVCNSATSKLDLEIDTTTPAAGNVAASAITGYKETFKLDGGTGAYNGIAATAFVPGPLPGYKTDLTNGYSSVASTVNVTGKVEVGPTKILPAGAYSVKVKATVTP